MAGIGRKLTEATPILTLGLGLLALFAGVDWWWMVFVFGWVVVTPLMGILFDGSETDVEADVRGDEISRAVRERVADEIAEGTGSGTVDDRIRDREDALDVLRERYAKGELDDVEFERKVERLLGTESIEDAERLLDDWSATDSTAADRTSAGERDRVDDRGDRVSDAERDREREFE